MNCCLELPVNLLIRQQTSVCRVNCLVHCCWIKESVTLSVVAPCLPGSTYCWLTAPSGLMVSSDPILAQLSIRRDKDILSCVGLARTQREWIARTVRVGIKHTHHHQTGLNSWLVQMADASRFRSFLLSWLVPGWWCTSTTHTGACNAH